MSIYRLYIDESGHHRYQRSDYPKERYLGLTGIVVQQDVYNNEVIPRIESLRKPFYDDYDLRPPLHLTDIMSAKNGFSRLKEETIRQQFNKELLELLSTVNYEIITVVIDKNGHQDRYISPEHPYHYSLACMLERYVKLLKYKNAKGDVMAEARGKKEDHMLRDVYSKFYSDGTSFAKPVDVQARLTSGKIKIRSKTYLIQGLEFADMIALCSKQDVLYTYGAIDSLDDNFTKKVIDTIQPKYYKGATGTKGNGKKFL